MPVSSKRRQVADALRDAIATGRYVPGERLPGEHELAERFSVSRGTVRAALADLADDEYIATHGGIGSVVTFDGAALDPRAGWARSIAGSGAEVSTVTLRIERVTADALTDPELAGVLVADTGFVAVDRVRSVVGGPAVSYERSIVPRLGRLDRAVEDGLVEGSLSATIAAAGLVPARAEQWIDVRPLDEPEALVLGRAPGTPFLHSRRVSRTAGGTFVEAVDSLLDPDRFRIHMRFQAATGQPARRRQDPARRRQDPAR